jgi:CshA-type fibril repeat protein
VTYQVADTDDLVVSAVITPSVVRPPTADDEETSGPYGVAQTANVLDGDVSYTGTPISPSTLRLLDPDTSTYVTSPVVISGEGTYSIVNGEIRFTPETDFYGEATPVRYRVADSLDQTVTALYTPTVAPPGPRAVDDTSTGFINQPQSADALADDESYTGVNLDPSLLTLCVDGVCGTSPVVVAGEGTYSIVDGDIVFTPDSGFVGEATPVAYRITDSNGLTDTATYTPTVVPPPLAVDDTPAPGPNDVPQIINVLSNDEESAVTESPFVPSTVALCNPSTAPPETAPNCSATSVTIESEGTYTVNLDGTVTFDPIDGFSGLVTVPVRYQVEDAQGQITSALISPSVTLPPTADNETTFGAYGAVQTSDVLDGDVSFTGVPLDAATLRIFDPQANGGVGAFVTTPVVLDGEGTYEIVNGKIQFTPAQGF